MTKPVAAYAANTSVSVENSRAEIERTLRRYKAEAFGYALDGRSATILFRIGARHIRFDLLMPDREDPAITTFRPGGGHSIARRTEAAIDQRWEQACRQRWRALSLVIKAKLEAVEAGISTIEDEFLAATMLPDGRTMGQWAGPEIDNAYKTGGMPRSLLLDRPRPREVK